MKSISELPFCKHHTAQANLLSVVALIVLAAAVACESGLDLAGAAGGNKDGGGLGGDDTAISGVSQGSGGGGNVSESTLVLNRPLTIMDRSGTPLGTGTVTVDSPKSVQQNLSATIRLEVTPSKLIDATDVATPEQSENSEMITVLVDDVTIHEIMGAEIRGVDVELFDIAAIPQDGVRLIQDSEVAWWEWSIRPKGEETVGRRMLSIALFLPRTMDGGVELNQEVAVIPLEIDVLPAPAVNTTNDTQVLAGAAGVAQSVGIIVGSITAIATLIGLIWRGWHAIEARNRKAFEAEREAGERKREKDQDEMRESRKNLSKELENRKTKDSKKT